MELVYDRLNQKVCVCGDCMIAINNSQFSLGSRETQAREVWPLKT